VRIDRRLVFFLLFYGCVLLVPIWQLSLFETTEGRYAEIAREMLASGNFLEPTFNGIYHFHKPPIPYWFMAAGMALFGVNDFGVRFFGVVAAVLSLYFLYRSAQIFFSDRRQSFAVVLTLASSPLFVAISRLVSTDIYLTCCVIGAQYYLFRQVYSKRSTTNAVGYGLFLGLGFMVKGPVIFLFTLLPQLVAKLVDPDHRRLFSLRDIVCGVGSFFVVAIPWYLAVIVRHPDLLTYFTKVQTVDRVATNRFNRDKPFWYFLYIFPATFLPYSIPLLRGAWRFRECPPRIRALCLYVFLPLLVFSVAKSKLPPYILPFYGTATLLVIYCYRELRSQWDDRVTFVIMLLLAAGIGVAGFCWSPLGYLRWPLAGAGSVLLLSCFVVYRFVNNTSQLYPVFAWYFIFVAVGCYLIIPSLIPKQLKGYRSMVMHMNALDPQRTVPTLVYKELLPSISFYRQELAIMVQGRIRETLFEQNDEYLKWYVQSDAELKQRVAPLSRLFVVTEPSHIGEFSSSTAFACSELLAQKRYTAYDCRPETVTLAR